MKTGRWEGERGGYEDGGACDLACVSLWKEDA